MIAGVQREAPLSALGEGLLEEGMLSCELQEGSDTSVLFTMFSPVPCDIWHKAAAH